MPHPESAPAGLRVGMSVIYIAMHHTAVCVSLVVCLFVCLCVCLHQNPELLDPAVDSDMQLEPAALAGTTVYSAIMTPNNSGGTFEALAH